METEMPEFTFQRDPLTDLWTVTYCGCVVDSGLDNADAESLRRALEQLE